MTYAEARSELMDLAARVARILNQFDGVQRETMHSLFLDDVFDLVTTEQRFDSEDLRVVFDRVCRDFWLREHSVKAPPALHAVPDLTEEGFEELVYPNGRNHE